MEFKFTGNSVVFEFQYKNFMISIADYVNCGEAEGKVSIQIQKHGQDLNEKTVERIAAYVQHRIKGVASATCGTLYVAPFQHDQLMFTLTDALDIIIPSS